VIEPAGVIRPMRFAKDSVNHRLPSAPLVIADGNAAVVGSANVVIVPPVVMRPMRLANASVNQR